MNDQWATPLDVFAALKAEFDFAMDVCASERNAKCGLFITEQQDSICVDWRKYLSTFGGRNDYAPSADDRYPAWCWCNPPYSNIGPWVQKAAGASRNSNLGVVMLANLQLGYFTPPVGMNLFIAAYRFNKPIGTLVRACLPFFLILGLAVALLTWWPGLSLGLL